MALAQVRDRSVTMDCRDQGLRWPRQVQNANGFDGDDSKDRYQDLRGSAMDWGHCNDSHRTMRSPSLSIRKTCAKLENADSAHRDSRMTLEMTPIPVFKAE